MSGAGSGDTEAEAVTVAVADMPDGEGIELDDEGGVDEMLVKEEADEIGMPEVAAGRELEEAGARVLEGVGVDDP